MCPLTLLLTEYLNFYLPVLLNWSQLSHVNCRFLPLCFCSFYLVDLELFTLVTNSCSLAFRHHFLLRSFSWFVSIFFLPCPTFLCAPRIACTCYHHCIHQTVLKWTLQMSTCKHTFLTQLGIHTGILHTGDSCIWNALLWSSHHTVELDWWQHNPLL